LTTPGRDRSRVAALAIVVLSRLYSIGLIAFAGSQSEAGWPHLTQAASPFAAWDAQWYLSIAETGYHREPLLSYEGGGYHDFAFFPLWPALIRLGTLGILPAELTAVVLANLLFVASGLILFEVFRRVSPDNVALRGLALVSFGPGAFVGSLAYSEPLFLALAAGWFLATARSRLRPVLAGAAQLARLTGVAVAAAAATGIRAQTAASAASMAAVAAAGIGWLTYVALLTGDPLGYLRGSPSWYAVTGSTGGLPSVIDGLRNPSAYLLVAVPLAFGLLIASGMRWRERPEMAAYSVVTVLMTILLAHWVNWPRHTLVAFPAFLVMAESLPRRAWLGILGLFSIGQAVLVIGTIRWSSFPP
jgi:hypothetical protein